MNGMRAEILKALAEMSDSYPDWRFVQLVTNASVWAGAVDGGWNVEDEQFLAALKRHLQNSNQSDIAHPSEPCEEREGVNKRIQIASLPHREKVVSEIFFNDIQWAEINQEGNTFGVEFYPRPDGEPWRLDYDAAINALHAAKQRLIGRSEPPISN